MALRKNRYADRGLFRRMIPSNAMPPSVIMDHGEGSGTGASKSPVGWFSPVMKLAFIAAPVVASYSPTVVPDWFATKRSLPDNARPAGLFSPVMKLALIAAPVVALYSPTVVPRPLPLMPKFDTKRLLPDNARLTGPFSPVMKLALSRLRWWRCIRQPWCRSRYRSPRRGYCPTTPCRRGRSAP